MLSFAGSSFLLRQKGSSDDKKAGVHWEDLAAPSGEVAK